MGWMIAAAFSVLTSLIPQISPQTLAWELGIKARVSVAGKVTSVSYYREAGDPGPHVGRVWSATGVKLAEVTFTNETGMEGWQTAALSSPLAMGAGTIFVVSVSTPVGSHYGKLPGALTNALVDGPVTYLANGSQYGTINVFPSSITQTYYFRDFTFLADAAPTIVVTSDGTPGGYTVKTDKFTAGKYQLKASLTDSVTGTVITSQPVDVQMPDQTVPTVKP